MDINSFAWWLHGFFEISESDTLTPKQVRIIKDHLELCFNKVTPDRSKEGSPQTYCSQAEKAAEPTEYGHKIPDVQVLSGASGSYYPRGYFGPENSHDYYVTVSKSPNFDNTSYSAYSTNGIVTNTVRAGLESAGLSGHFMLTIDDSLNPTGQDAKGLVGDKHMIRGLPIEGPGLVNIGYGVPLYC